MKNLKKISRNDLKNVIGGKLLGGGGSCRISVQYAGGGYGVFDTPTSGSCSNQQTQANSQCLNLIGNPNSGTRCSYDCGCDGYGH
jgi:hypothetical protein